MSLLHTATREASNATDERIRVAALIRVGVYLARRGDVGACNEVISRLRSEYSAQNYTLAIAGANLCEGVLAFCAINLQSASDKLRRSAAMASSIRAEELERWVDSWQCHVEYSMAHYEESAKRAAQVVRSAGYGEHCTISRVATTVAGACHFFAGYEAARPWYEVARLHSVAEGDDLTIDAILHARAAFRLNALRLVALESSVNKTEVDAAGLELSSSINYDRAKSPDSFRWMLPLLNVHLEILRENSERARELITQWLRDCAPLANGRHASILSADLAWCLAHLGRNVEAKTQLDLAASTVAADAELDDLALIKFQCARAAELIGANSEANRLRAEFKTHLDAFRQAQARIAPLFAAIPLPTSQ